MQITRRSDFSEKTEYSFRDVPVLINRADIQKYTDGGCLAHWHEDVEFVIIESGQFVYAVNGERIPLTTGEGLFVNSGQMHWNMSLGDMECKFVCVRFSPVILCGNSHIAHRYVTPLLDNSSMPYMKLTDGDAAGKRMLDILRRLAVYAVDCDRFQPGSSVAAVESGNCPDSSTDSASEQGDFYSVEIVGLLYMLWSSLAGVPGALAANALGKSAALESLQTMIAYMNQNYTAKLKLQDICDAGAMGKTNCCQIFQRYTGRSPMEYLQALRLEKAESLLTGTDMTVTEIAYETGFGGASYFTEVFGAQYGCTPSAFRKKRV